MYSQKIYLIFIDLALFTFCFLKLELERKRKKQNKTKTSTAQCWLYFLKLIYFVYSSHTCFIYQTPKLYKCRLLEFVEASNSVEILISCDIIRHMGMKMSASLV